MTPRNRLSYRQGMRLWNIQRHDPFRGFAAPIMTLDVLLFCAFSLFTSESALAAPSDGSPSSLRAPATAAATPLFPDAPRPRSTPSPVSQRPTPRPLGPEDSADCKLAVKIAAACAREGGKPAPCPVSEVIERQTKEAASQDVAASTGIGADISTPPTHPEKLRTAFERACELGCRSVRNRSALPNPFRVCVEVGLIEAPLGTPPSPKPQSGK